MDEFDDDVNGRTKFTATDALSCKISATNLGYYKDKYLSCMRVNRTDTRKQPIINRGRTWTIDVLSNTFFLQ